MQFRQLEYFVALARERHFARAAAACYVSQPALSEAIRKLEHELRVPLVRRSRVFEGLTPEGERLVLWARRILADHEALKQEVTALQTGLTGELRLGVIPAAASTAALLTDPFCAEHPLVRVSIETALRSGDIAERIRRFELDAGLIHPDAEDAAGLLVAPLYEDRQVLIAGRALLPTGADQLAWEEATALPMCLLNPDMRGRQLVDAALAARGLKAAPQVETDSVVTLLAHISTGRWASIVPQSWLLTFPAPAGAAVLPLDGPDEGAPIALVTSAQEPASVLARAFADAARAAAGHGVLGPPPAPRPTPRPPAASPPRTPPG